MKRTIGEWQINDWNGGFPTTYATPRGDDLEFDSSSKKLTVRMQITVIDDLSDDPRLQIETLDIPVEILKDVLERNGYNVSERDADGK